MYRNNLLSIVAIAMVVSVLSGARPVYALPEDQTIEYSIYETPTDPQSAVVFVVEMTLVADSSASGEVGWDVTELVYVQPGEGSNPDVVWVESSPVVDSPDGLWWVDHADVENPVLAEFALPPSFVGTAAPEDPLKDDLEYDLQGVTYTPPPAPGEPPHEATAALDYTFTLATAQELIEEGDDEPIEISDNVQD